MKRSGVLVLSAAFAVAGVLHARPAGADPTPIPGGANQLSGVSGGLSSQLFNGKVRIRQMALRPSTAAEYTPADNQHGFIFSYLVSNGTSSTRAGSFNASISDADGVVIPGKAVSVYSTFYSLEPGAAARGTIQFILPAGYTPAKILLVDQGGPSGPAFRIQLKPADLPSPAAT